MLMIDLDWSALQFPITWWPLSQGAGCKRWPRTAGDLPAFSAIGFSICVVRPGSTSAVRFVSKDCGSGSSRSFI